MRSQSPTYPIPPAKQLKSTSSPASIIALFAMNYNKFQTPGTHSSVALLLQPLTPCCTGLQAPSCHLQQPLAIPLPPIVQTLTAISLTSSGGPSTGTTVQGSLLNRSQTTCGLRQSSKNSKAHVFKTLCSRASSCSKCFSVSYISASSKR